MHKAIFYDRDGTLVEDRDYAYKIEDFKMLPGVVRGLKILSKEFIFFVITNQAGVGRGIFTIGDMHKFNEKLLNELKKESIEIKKVYYCPHKLEDNCDCRKPSIKNIKQAEKEFNINLRNSWVVGDRPSDIGMGIKAGCRNIYMLTGHGSKHLEDLKSGKIEPDFIANNFLDAAKFIMSHTKR